MIQIEEISFGRIHTVCMNSFWKTKINQLDWKVTIIQNFWWGGQFLKKAFLIVHPPEV